MPGSSDPTVRVLAARLAALMRWSKEDPLAGTEKARETFRRSFEDRVDPDGVLPLQERARRAEALRRAYYTKLALKSVIARKARRAVTTPDEEGAA